MNFDQSPVKAESVDDSLQLTPFTLTNKEQGSNQKHHDSRMSPGLVQPKQGRSSPPESSPHTPHRKIASIVENRTEIDNPASPLTARKEIEPKFTKRHGSTQQNSQHQLRKDQSNNDEVLNIRVQGSKLDRNKAAALEVWSENQAKDIEVSFVDSDVADEFEYQFDPSYANRVSQTHSPQKRTKQSSKLQSRMSKRSSKQKSMTQDNEVQFGETGAGGDLIKVACKQISQLKPPQKKTKDFVKRMAFDQTKRESREKTFDTLKVQIAMRMCSPHSSTMGSPRNDNQYLGNSLSPVKGDLADNNQGPMSPTTKRKLKPKECAEIYDRLLQYQERKQKAVDMLQEAKKREEEQEVEFYIHQRKMTSQQQQQCYNRLARDAEVRRANEKQRKEAELLKKEEEMKKLFKPKINQKYSVNKGAALQSPVSKNKYGARLDQFQNDAFERSSARSQASPIVVSSKRQLHESQTSNQINYTQQ